MLDTLLLGLRLAVDPAWSQTWFPEGSIKMATRAYPTALCSEEKRSRVSTLIIAVLVISIRWKWHMDGCVGGR